MNFKIWSCIFLNQNELISVEVFTSESQAIEWARETSEINEQVFYGFEERTQPEHYRETVYIWSFNQSQIHVFEENLQV